MRDTLATLLADYAALETNPPAYLDSDQQRSLIFYRAERGIASAEQVPFRVGRWLVELHDLEAFVQKEKRFPRENNRLKREGISERERHLADWVRSQRRALADGRRCEYQRRRLLTLSTFESDPIKNRWLERRDAYQAFLSLFGQPPRVRSADQVERQAGCIGLMRGLQGWDHTKGFALSTFVSWHIRQTIQRWRANEVLLIRLPVHVWEGLDSTNGLTPEVRESAVRAQNIFSVDEMDEESWEWDSDGGLFEAELAFERHRIVRELLTSLKGNEATVISLRFGLVEIGDEPMTLDAIGEVLGVTRERIRQIEKKALGKLRDSVDDVDSWLHLV